MTKTAIFRVLFSKRMLILILMGFSSGLPLLATGSTLQAWMSDEQVDLALIGIFSLVGLPYTIKFLWAPVMDRYIPPFLGRRRGWTLIFQITVILSLLLLSFAKPAQSPGMVALFALLVTLFSASQDVVLDAYRRDLLPENELGLGTSFFINGYRIGMLVSGALALFLADQLPWQTVYIILSVFMLIGIVTTLFAPTPARDTNHPKSLKAAVLDPFIDYFKKEQAWIILAFILLYKIGDLMASNMTTPFILQIGFSKTELAAIAKTFGLAATLVGGLAGGILILKTGIVRALWIFGFLQMISTFGFSLQAVVGYDLWVLTGVIAFENLASGMGTSAFAAYMASLCNQCFTATQYALLSSLMGIPRVILAAPTGWMAKNLGWPFFFALCALLAIPGLLLLFKVAPWRKNRV